MDSAKLLAALGPLSSAVDSKDFEPNDQFKDSNSDSNEKTTPSSPDRKTNLENKNPESPETSKNTMNSDNLVKSLESEKQQEEDQILVKHTLTIKHLADNTNMKSAIHSNESATNFDNKDSTNPTLKAMQGAGGSQDLKATLEMLMSAMAKNNGSTASGSGSPGMQQPPTPPNVRDGSMR